MRTAVGEAAFPSDVGTYYWGGAGGTYFWVDPKSDLFVVLMLHSPKLRVYDRTLLQDMCGRGREVARPRSALNESGEPPSRPSDESISRHKETQ